MKNLISIVDYKYINYLGFHAIYDYHEKIALIYAGNYNCENKGENNISPINVLEIIRNLEFIEAEKRIKNKINLLKKTPVGIGDIRGKIMKKKDLIELLNNKVNILGEKVI